MDKTPAQITFEAIAGAAATNKTLNTQLTHFNAAMDRLLARDQSWGGWARTKVLKGKLRMKRATGL